MLLFHTSRGQLCCMASWLYSFSFLSMQKQNAVFDKSNLNINLSFRIWFTISLIGVTTFPSFLFAFLFLFITAWKLLLSLGDFMGSCTHGAKLPSSTLNLQTLPQNYSKITLIQPQRKKFAIQAGVGSGLQGRSLRALDQEGPKI